MDEFKPGFYEYHTKDCDIELRDTDKGSYWGGQAYRRYWCNTHRQWCYERPVKVTWTFADGTEISQERPSC